MKDIKQSKPVIRIFHVLARSGGTVVSRCIGSMDNIILLSEIHPAGMRFFNPLGQALKWHNLITLDDISACKSKGLTEFHDAVGLIEGACTDRRKSLVIRDWSHMDFTGAPFVKPSYSSCITNALDKHFNVVNFSMVRHPISQWISLSKLSVMKNKLTLDEFLRGYRHFSNHAIKTGFVKFEDFTNSPDRILSVLCHSLKINYDKKYKSRWFKYNKVTGDLSGHTRVSRIIRPAELPTLTNELLENFSKNKDYNEAINILGYDHPNK